MDSMKLLGMSELPQQLNLNTPLFVKGSIGALMVIFGVVVKNTLEQMDMKDN